jgi:hypothetical protein
MPHQRAKRFHPKRFEFDFYRIANGWRVGGYVARIDRRWWVRAYLGRTTISVNAPRIFPRRPR